MPARALRIVRRYYPGIDHVVDASEPVKISVTAEDCKYSRSGKPSACAMAKAFKRDYDGAIISMSMAYLIRGNVATRYRVPGRVSRELVSFDRSHRFAPGEYELKQVEPMRKLGPRLYPPPNRTDPNKRSGEIKQRHHTEGVRSL